MFHKPTTTLWLNRVVGRKAGIAKDDPVSKVLFKWKELDSKPLPGRTVACKTVFSDMSREDVIYAFSTLERIGIEVDRISYVESVHLWTTLMNAVIPLEDYLKMFELRDVLCDPKQLAEVSPKQKDNMLKFQSRVFSEAAKNADMIRKTVATQLHSSTLKSNLLGE